MGKADEGGRPHPEAGLNARLLQDLDDDIRDHVERETRDNIERGLAPADARLAALRRFGRLLTVKEDARAVWIPGWLDQAGQDLRYAIRAMRKTPGFAVVAILTLAIGIGVNTAIFSVADALVLRPLPVDRPDELRAVFQVLRLDGRAVKSGTLVPYSLYQSLRQYGDVFTETMAFADLDELAIEFAEGQPLGVHADFVSDNYFDVLGVMPAIGRAFEPGEDAAGAGGRLAILSDRFWRRAFDADRAVLGRTLRVAGESFTVVGVAPREFFGVVLGRSPDVYLPLDALGAAQPGFVSARQSDSWMVHVVGRVAGAVGEEAAAGRLTEMMQAAMPVEPKPVIELLPIDTGFSSVRAQFLRPAQVLSTLVVTLLLMACANVAVMLLSRNLARRRELATRLAIGASRTRIARQLLTEGLVLALAGASIGLALTPWATSGIIALLPGGTTPMSVHVARDARVLVFTACVSIVSALVFTALPALRVMRLDPTESIADRSRTATGARVRFGSALLVTQIVLSLTLVSGAAFFGRTLYNLSTFNPGFDADRVVLLEVTPASRGYVDDRRAAYYAELLERLTSVRSVESVSLSQLSFLDRENRTTGTIDGPGAVLLANNERLVDIYFVGPRFFETLGIPLLKGRDFHASDMTGPRVAVVNETAARRFFAGTEPVGAVVNGSVEVLGVAGDSRYHQLRDDLAPAMFIPYTHTRIRERMVFSVRASGDEIAGQLLREARALDPLVPMRVTSLGDVKRKSLSQERLLAVLAAVFAVTALALMAISLFGVVTFRGRQRTAEIGIRLALGARGGQVIWLMMRGPLAHAAAGLAVGVPATQATGRLTTALLFGVAPTDVPTLAVACVILFAIVVAATAWPAWRASRLDPAAALRCE